MAGLVDLEAAGAHMGRERGVQCNSLLPQWLKAAEQCHRCL